MNTYGKHTPWSAGSSQDQAAAGDPGYGEPDYQEPGYGDQADSADQAGAMQHGRHEGDPVAGEPGAGAAAGPGEQGAGADDVVVVEPVSARDVSQVGDGTAASNVNGSLAGTAGAASSAAEWSEIKALFVDDPSDSVQRASALVERAVQGFMASLRQRQDSLRTWHEGDAAGTEELRTALRGYRNLLDQLEQMSGEFASSGVSGSSAAGARPSSAAGARTASSAGAASAEPDAGAAAPAGSI
jgi:hypothetical protein